MRMRPWPQSAVRVRVPATSANLGPGFDALGLALALHDDVEARITGDGLSIDVEGEGAAALVGAGEDHLVVQAMRKAFDMFAQRQPPGLALRCTNRIPHGRGLGSSAAAIVAGLLAAQALSDPVPEGPVPEGPVPGGPVPEGGDLLALATEIEGHPDNVAACLAGGLTIAWMENKAESRMVRLDPLPAITPVLCVAPPDVAVRTEVARQALPETVPHKDAAANAARTALLVAALTQPVAAGALFDATEDWLHQDYRAQAMPDTHALVRKLRDVRIPAVVSGAGPSVLALLGPDSTHLLDSLGSIVRETGKAWHISPLDVERQGAHLLRPLADGPRGTVTLSLRDTDGCEGMP